MVTVPSYLYGLAAMVFITAGLVVAAVRWFHMCRPFDQNPQYYYPGRPFVVGIYLCSLFLLPYALRPDSADAWFLAKLYFLPVTLYHFTILLLSYFGNVMQWKKWRVPMFIIGFPVALSLLAAVVLALVPGDQAGRIFSVVFLLLGIIMTAVCLAAMWVVLRWAGSLDEDEYSNPTDFPVIFARKWLGMVVINIILCWAGALFDSPALMAMIMLLLSVSSVVFIITALHPHRSRPVDAGTPEEPSSPESPSSQMYHRNLSEKKRLEILSAICCVVEEQEAFVDPHLTLQDVAERSGYNRSYISGLIKTEFGGFFAYINRLRLAHVERWMLEHPDATIQEAVEVSGFSSRQAYYNVKARFEKE